MILTLDIGNTSITCGLFDNDKLVKEFRLPTNISLSASEFGNILKSKIHTKIEGAIIGSVVDSKGVNNTVISVLKESFGIEPILLSYKSKMPIKLSIKEPQEIGADRIANGVRAHILYPKQAVIVIDFGTAITFDIVNSKGEFIGGIIAPGVKTQLNSLCKSTDKLPDIEPQAIDHIIGNDTKDCILSGVIRGIACMIEGMLEKCENELGEKVVIIATGGHSKLISKYITKKIDLISPEFTLEGLKDLYYINQ